MPSAVGQGLGQPWDTLKPPLTPWVRDVITKLGFERMTPVQSGTIPRAMKNQDCVVEAVTGSGKTLAFIIPILERMCRRETPFRKGQVGAIVIAPTRELAQQIHEVFHHFLSSLIPPEKPDDPSSSRSPSPLPNDDQAEAPYPLPMLITSGTPTPYETFQSLASSILIGTPGRLASFLLSPRGLNIVKVTELDALVLDEADRLLSAPDHRRDVERIMRHLPKQRRTHLFSATMTDAVEDIIGIGLRNPVRIVVNLKDKRTGEEAQERRTPTSLTNTCIVCRPAEKTVQLIRLLLRESLQREAAKFIVYFSTVAAVDYFYRILSRLPELSSYTFTSLHGDLPPRVRENALSSFTSHPSSHLSPAVMLCTDVAARGVDFANMDIVIQYDPPTDPKTFSHRAGRTARAGRSGKAILLLTKGREEEYVDFLAVRKIPLVKESYLETADLATSTNNGDSSSSSTIPLARAIDSAAIDLMHRMRAILLTDRELHDKAAKAFVSSLRAYSKHEASFIFRLADVDFHSLAISYGLLRMPAMPEIKTWRKKQEAVKAKGKEKAEEDVEAVEEMVEWQDEQVDWDTFAYLSKSRETARLAALATKKANAPTLSEAQKEARVKRKIEAEMRIPWSDQKERKTKKEERRTRKDQQKQLEWEKAQAEGAGEIGMVEAFRRANGKKRALGDIEEEGGEGAGEEPPSSDPKAAKEKARAQEKGEIDLDYKAMKKEMKEERAGKRGKKEEKRPVGGAFDDLD